MCRPFPAARTALRTTGSAGPMRNSWKRPCPRCSAGRAGRTCPRALCRRASTSSGTGSRSWATAASGTGSRPRSPRAPPLRLLHRPRLSRPGLRHGGPAPAAGHRPGPRAGGGVLPPRQQGQPGLPARHAPQRGLHPPRGRRALLRANPQEQVKKTECGPHRGPHSPSAEKPFRRRRERAECLSERCNLQGSQARRRCRHAQSADPIGVRTLFAFGKRDHLRNMPRSSFHLAKWTMLPSGSRKKKVQ